jgi:thymidylate synthase (FAD)
MHFLGRRADEHAQYEIRAYADAMLETVKRWVPLCFDAFVAYHVGGTRLSEKGLAVVKRLIAGEPVERQSSGLSPREWRELMATLGREEG